MYDDYHFKAMIMDAEVLNLTAQLYPGALLAMLKQNIPWY